MQSTNATTGSANQISITPSNSVRAGDLIVVGVSINSGTGTVVGSPSDFARVDMVSRDADVTLATFVHTATSSDAGRSYTFPFTGPRSPAGMSAVLYEVSGVSTSGPIAARASNSAGTGWSSTTPSVNPTADGQVGLAFFAQYIGGTQPTFFNGSPTWDGRYSPIFAGDNSIVMESLSSNVSASSAASANVVWQNGHNGSQVSEIVLLTPTGGNTVPSSPTSTSTPTPSTPSTPNAPSSGPSKVHTMLLYGGHYVNQGIPASQMVQYADAVETAENPQYANSFMNAGGWQAFLYADPNLVPGCDYGTYCSGPMGNTTPESAWLHDSNGNRLRTSSGQDALNPMSSAARQSFANYSASLTNGTRFTGVMVDDANPSYDAGYWQYKTGATPVEMNYASASDWLNGEAAMVSAASRPGLYNGGNWDSSEDTMLSAPNVAGRFVEGCATFGAFRVNDTQDDPRNQWRPSMNKLINATNRGKLAVCLNYAVNGGDVVGDRMYALTSWWMTYDQNDSVAFPNFPLGDTYNGSDSQTYAEYLIVPTQPLQTAGSDVNDLRTSGGAYLREFAACYQNGNLIGRCAAVVNPSYGSTVSMPSTRQSYSRHLVLDHHSAINGGQANWTGGVPGSISPETGYVLLQ